jgi:hypothetical protein
MTMTYEPRKVATKRAHCRNLWSVVTGWQLDCGSVNAPLDRVALYHGLLRGIILATLSEPERETKLVSCLLSIAVDHYPVGNGGFVISEEKKGGFVRKLVAEHDGIEWVLTATSAPISCS